MDPLNLESQNQTKNNAVYLPTSVIKIWGKSVKAFLLWNRTSKQTNRDFICIDKTDIPDADDEELTDDEIDRYDSGDKN